MQKVNNIVIVGAMANNFLAYKGFKLGKSLLEENTKKIISNIYNEAKKNNCKIIIPKDFGVASSFESSTNIKKKSSLNKDEIILDIGPETIKNIENIIDNSNTILWNGPAGYFENKN